MPLWENRRDQGTINAQGPCNGRDLIWGRVPWTFQQVTHVQTQRKVVIPKALGSWSQGKIPSPTSNVTISMALHM